MATDKFITLEELDTTTQALLSKINEQSNLKVDKINVNSALNSGIKIGSIDGKDFYAPEGVTSDDLNDLYDQFPWEVSDLYNDVGYVTTATQVKSNWNETATANAAFILNKPAIIASATGTNATIENDLEHNKAIGIYSHAEGWQTFAGGTASHAEGNVATVFGYAAHGEGQGTTAAGAYSHAEGYKTYAATTASHAEGWNTVASGISAHGEGLSSIASGNYSHAEGYMSQATGDQAHVEGYHSLASARSAHAEGYTTTASGAEAHAEGGWTLASGTEAHAEGYMSQATGNQAHAEGSQTLASGARSHAEGNQTGAIGFAAHAEGNSTTASCNLSHAEGWKTFAGGTASHAEGYSTTATGLASYAGGIKTITSATAAHAEGIDTIASGIAAHAEGNSTTASGSYSHAEGYNTLAQRRSQHTFGEYNISDTAGTGVTVKGDYIEIVGNGSSSTNRANARTLDWSGNEWLAGRLTVGAAPTTAMHVATKKYVDEYIPSKIETYVTGIEPYSVNVRTTTTSVQAVYDDNYVRSSITLKGTGIEISTERFSNEILTIKNNQILGLANPTTATHAANKAYVDNAIPNISITNTLSSGTLIATINGTNIYAPALPIYDGTVV